MRNLGIDVNEVSAHSARMNIAYYRDGPEGEQIFHNYVQHCCDHLVNIQFYWFTKSLQILSSALIICVDYVLCRKQLA